MVENGDDLAASVPTAENTRVGMPRWVKVSLTVLGVLVLAFVLAKVIGVGGEHGPGRHGDGDDSGEVVDEDGEHRPPVDHGG